MSPSPGSVSVLLARWLDGDAKAFTELCLRYHRHLVSLARRHLASRPRCRLVGEDDLAQEALLALHRRMREGKPLVLRCREDLLALLSCLVTRNVWKKVRAEAGTQKRQGTVSLDESLAAAATDPHLNPEEEAAANDLLERCLACLPAEPPNPRSPGLRAIAQLYLAGHSQEEVGRLVGCNTDTVGRKLRTQILPLLQNWASQFSDPAGAGAPPPPG